MKTVSSATATTLWLRSWKQPQISGRFEAIVDKLSNGKSVWRQVVVAGGGALDDDKNLNFGPGWIYNSADNHWFVTVHESCVGETGGIIGALEETSSSVEEDLPLSKSHTWKRWDGPNLGWNEHITKDDVQWTTSIELGKKWEKELQDRYEKRWNLWPNQILVTEEKNNDFEVPKELLGIYTKLGGTEGESSDLSTSFCGQPVWKKDDNSSHLYSDAFGFWRIGTDELIDAGPPGYIQSQDIVATFQEVPPTDPSIVWMVDGGGCGCGSSTKEDDDDETTTTVQEWKVNSNLRVSAIVEGSTDTTTTITAEK